MPQKEEEKAFDKSVNSRKADFVEGTLVDDYIIVRKLASGGMSTVYLAKQLSLDRNIAMKVIHPELATDEEYLKSFLNEARSLAQLRHENIVEAYAIGRKDELIYLVMEYVDGVNLRDIVQQNGILDWKSALKIINKIASGLKYAFNTKGLVHRDVKAENIIIGKKQEVKIADFGLASHVGKRTADFDKSVFGTPEYVAPEIIMGRNATVQSDIYSLGVTLFYALTGKYPYEADTADKIIDMHYKSSFAFPEEFVQIIPESVKELCQIMLAKRPGHRYACYEDLCTDIECILSGESLNFIPSADSQTPIDDSASDPFVVTSTIIKKQKRQENTEKTVIVGVNMTDLQFIHSKYFTACVIIIMVLCAALLCMSICGGKNGCDENLVKEFLAKYTNASGTTGKQMIAEMQHAFNMDDALAQRLVHLYDEQPEKQTETPVKKNVTYIPPAPIAPEDSNDNTVSEAINGNSTVAPQPVAENVVAQDNIQEQQNNAPEHQEIEQAQNNDFVLFQENFRKNLTTAKNTENNYSDAIIDIRQYFKSNIKEQSIWSTEWGKRIEIARDFYKKFRNSKEKYRGVQFIVPGSTDNWTIKDISFDVITLECTQNNVDNINKLQKEVNLYTLLPQQFAMLSNGLTVKDNIPEKEATYSLCLYLMCRGAALQYVQNYLTLYGDKFAAKEAALLKADDYLNTIINTLDGKDLRTINQSLVFLHQTCGKDAFPPHQAEIDRIILDAKNKQ